MHVSGVATLGGTLAIGGIGTPPEVGSYDILTYGSLVGDFLAFQFLQVDPFMWNANAGSQGYWVTLE